MSEQEREAARVERRDVIESNKEWDSATTVRRTWLRGYLTRKSAPKGTASFLAGSAANDPDTLASHDRRPIRIRPDRHVTNRSITRFHQCTASQRAVTIRSWALDTCRSVAADSRYTA